MIIDDIRIDLEIVKVLLERGISGEKYDPSWAYSQRISVDEQEYCLKSAYEIITDILNELSNGHRRTL